MVAQALGVMEGFFKIWQCRQASGLEADLFFWGGRPKAHSVVVVVLALRVRLRSLIARGVYSQPGPVHC